MIGQGPGPSKMAMALTRAIESGRKHYLGQKACINICNHTLKFSNYVLLRVPINKYNYEQPIELFIPLAKNTFAMV